MSTAKKTSKTIVLEVSATEQTGDAETFEYSGNEADSASFDDVAAPTCSACGELLAWHEEPCRVANVTSPDIYTAAASKDVADSGNCGIVLGFTYAIGQPVQPAPARQVGKVIWRGQVKERHPRTGLLHRVNVYRLDNGYWDCYYEAELQAA
ncbi:hypothetical protein [Hymenobacter norwichensis]|uniref:hypothetical protein n=1 Tax=Hymenobacter norwichensis TaxID=223903 RepID=UPI0003B5CD9D|nr:hypothetical protein [Hymenobacter norwichensis]